MSNDTLSRFLIEGTGVRGVLVSLDNTWQGIRERAAYPTPVQHWLGEAAAAAALFAGHLKINGRLSVQLKGHGALRTLFAECTAGGTLRGIARLREGSVPTRLAELGADAVLAMTIESRLPGSDDVQRYQGLIGLEADTLAGAFTDYFRQSEQLPSALLLAANDERAAGLFLQQLPDGHGDADGWTRVLALFDTLGPRELLAKPNHDTLWHLFHEDGVRLLEETALRFECSCSRERVAEMFLGLGESEAMAAAADGAAQVECEFCGAHYAFSDRELLALFSACRSPTPPPHPTVQ